MGCRIVSFKLFSCSLDSPPIELQNTSFLSCNRVTSTTIARLLTRHFKRMKMSPDCQRSYNTCSHCPDIQLSPNPIYNCPILAKLPNKNLRLPDHQLLYSSNVINITRAILDTLNAI
ncbi:hypothetical protein TNCV_1741161 [Trichonephila clavipes]|uniref:Uncharacterized protein n=1 Tax=Trichonephila clavipes TaxID=2585209 RepID=A0A8X6RIF4_TRICX|nr:hypothetical protein TNCV_1741161 [Trichonephila clavipes]